MLVACLVVVQRCEAVSRAQLGGEGGEEREGGVLGGETAMSGSTSPHLARPIKPHDGAMRADGTQEQSANCEQLSTN